MCDIEQFHRTWQQFRRGLGLKSEAYLHSNNFTGGFDRLLVYRGPRNILSTIMLAHFDYSGYHLV